MTRPAGCTVVTIHPGLQLLPYAIQCQARRTAAVLLHDTTTVCTILPVPYSKALQVCNEH